MTSHPRRRSLPGEEEAPARIVLPAAAAVVSACATAKTETAEPQIAAPAAAPETGVPPGMEPCGDGPVSPFIRGAGDAAEPAESSPK